MKPYAPAVGFILIAAVSLATATTFHVDVSGGGDFLTIQEGIDAAQSIGLRRIANVGTCRATLRFTWAATWW